MSAILKLAFGCSGGSVNDSSAIRLLFASCCTAKCLSYRRMQNGAQELLRLMPVTLVVHFEHVTACSLLVSFLKSFRCACRCDDIAERSPNEGDTSSRLAFCHCCRRRRVCRCRCHEWNQA